MRYLSCNARAMIAARRRHYDAQHLHPGNQRTETGSCLQAGTDGASPEAAGVILASGHFWTREKLVS